MSSNFEVEPGAALESVLMTTDTLENFDQMSSSLDEIKCGTVASTSDESNFINSNNDYFEESTQKSENGVDTDEEIENNDDWTSKKKQIFVLSSAGKPIYSRFGNENKLAWLFGVMQTLVSFVQSSDDNIRSIHAGNTLFVFLSKKPLILVTVSKTGESVNQLTLQLNYVFNQIVSMFTLTTLNRIYEERQNYDLRNLLVTRLIDHLLDFTEKEPSFVVGAVQCLPLASSIRDSVSSAITGACGKIKNLVFAILLANNRLITLVRMKKYCLHPADLHLIFNLAEASQGQKDSENWLPLCLPRFDASGFLYAYFSFLTECQAWLFLLTVEKDVFYTLKAAREKIVERLSKSNCIEPLKESLAVLEETTLNAGFPELRHYLYKCKSTAQFYQSTISPPYTKDQSKLISIYKRAHQKLHYSVSPLKLIFERSSNEAVLAWDTKGFELYVIFEPLIDTSNAINFVGKLLSWIKKREDRLFHLNAPTF